MLLSVSVLAIVSLAVAQSIIGVSPDMESLYKPDSNGNWHCLLDPSHIIKFDQINNNFCDCPDGSDEPGTNACEYTLESPKMFYCANEGFIPKHIENYKLNDGVCDYDICCDGLDEYLSGNCPNVCSKVKRQYDEYMSSKRKEIANGIRARRDLERMAAELRAAFKQSISELVSSIEEIEQKEIAGILANSRFVDDQQDKLLFIVKGDKLSELSEFYIATNKEQEKTIEQLESLMLKMSKNYNPNFNDAAVKSAINAFQDYYSNKVESAVLVPNINDILVDRYTLSSQNCKNGVIGILRDNILSWPGTLHKYFDQFVETFPNHNSKESNKLTNDNGNKNEGGQAKHSLESLHRKLAANRAEYDRNYGENDVLLALKNQPYEKKIGEYTYKIDFMNSVYQDRTLVGRYDSFEDDSMEFVSGDRCWNGPQRSATVKLLCAEEFDLLSVDEPQKCHYEFILTSPVACKDLSEEELAKGFKLDKAVLF